MKKTISILLALVFVVLLAGCGNGSKANNEVHDVAQQAVVITDDFLDDKITHEQAVERLNTLTKQIEQMEQPKDLLQAANFLTLSASVATLSLSLSLYGSGAQTSKDDIRNLRDSLNQL